MKPKRVSIFLFLAAILATTTAIPALSVLASSSNVPSLQFAPQLIMNPNRETMTSGGGFACITAPTDGFHCYTPTQIHAAYDLNALYADGINGNGETIVIVDAYGSPTALADLNTFSSTFGLPSMNLSPETETVCATNPTFTEVYPTGTPSFNPSQHGVQVGWAVETSLDLQSSHAIAPCANIVLVAANPAET